METPSPDTEPVATPSPRRRRDRAKDLQKLHAVRQQQKEEREAALRGEFPERLEEEPDLYDAMCHVLNFEKHLDVTPLQATARAWLKDTPGKFLEKYAELQKAREPEKPADGEVKEDEGTEAALAHLDRFLSGLKGAIDAEPR